MPQELIYTSVPKGLKSGSSGFTTVLHTAGMAPNLIERLENLSGYTYLFPPDSNQAGLNPPVLTHYRLDLAGKTFHVISRNAPYGMDYTGRSNNLAHHIVFQSNEELPLCGPVKLLEKSMETKFTGTPRVVPFSREISFPVPKESVCFTWKEVTGDAGWAAQLVEKAQKGKIVTILFRPGMNVTQLLSEALLLFPEKDRWQVTFSTCFTSLQAGLTCQWRFIPVIPQERPKVPQNAFVLDLTKPMEKAPDTPLAEFARTGKFQIQKSEIISKPQPSPTSIPSVHRPAVRKEIGDRLPPSYTPKNPMDLPVYNVDPTKIYQPEKKKSVTGWFISGTAAVIITLVICGYFVFYAINESNKKISNLMDDGKETLEVQQKNEGVSPHESTTAQLDDNQDNFLPKKSKYINEDSTNEPNSSKEEKEEPTLEVYIRDADIQDNDNNTPYPLDKNLTYKLDNESDIEVWTLDENNKIESDENGVYHIDKTPFLEFQDDHKTLQFKKSTNLKDFLGKYKILTYAIKYELNIDGTQINVSSVIDENGTITLELSDILQLEFQGNEKFKFDLENLTICKDDDILLIYKYDDRSKNGRFVKGDRLTKDLLREFCKECKFVKDEKTRVPMFDSDGNLLALVEDSGTGKKKYVFKCPKFEKRKGEELQLQNDNGEVVGKVTEKEDKSTIRIEKEQFSGGRICLVKKEEPKQETEESISLLTLEELKKEDFWFDIDQKRYLPQFENKMIDNTNRYQLDPRKKYVQDNKHGGNTVIDIHKKTYEDLPVFLLEKSKGATNDNMPRKLVFTFLDSPDEQIYIFFSAPEYGQKKMKVEKKSEQPVPDEYKDQKPKLLSCNFNSVGPITLKIKNPKSKDDKDKIIEKKVDFKIEKDDTTVTFKNDNEQITLKAEAKIGFEGKPVLELVDKGKCQDNVEDILKQIQQVEFSWKIMENDHLRSTSEPKPNK